MRGWRLLVLAAVLGALLVSALARRPQRGRAPAAAPPPAPVSRLALEYAEGRLVPESGSVPKGHRVLLSIANRGTVPVALVLAGYADRVRTGPIAPGGRWRGEFLADLPGEDFAWLRDGSADPVGRLAVTGSHLVEGHR